MIGWTHLFHIRLATPIHMAFSRFFPTINNLSKHAFICIHSKTTCSTFCLAFWIRPHISRFVGCIADELDVDKLYWNPNHVILTEFCPITCHFWEVSSCFSCVLCLTFVFKITPLLIYNHTFIFFSLISFPYNLLSNLIGWTISRLSVYLNHPSIIF